MGFEYNDAQKETGVDVALEVPTGDELAITSASFSEEAETSEVQFNDSYSQNIAVTGVTFSGSFEVAGRAEKRDGVYTGAVENEGEVDVDLPKYLTSITFKETGEGGKTYTFSNVLITSHSKDVPADDRTTESFDFTAEKMNTD